MKKPLNLGNSIYQRNGSAAGLTVQGGMLINNRPDGQTGIAQAVEMKKTIRRAEKINTMSVAFSLGELRSESEDCGCD